jgi:multicomponent Na+:H+ antiporter subunit D
MTNAAPLAVLVPVVAGALHALLSAFTDRRDGLLAFAALVATAVLCAVVLGDAGARPVVWLGGWLPQGPIAVGIGLTIDPLGAAMALFVAVLGVLASVLSARLVASRGLVFDALLLTLIGAMIGFCYAGDLFTLFVLLELMSITAFVLVGYEVGERTPLTGALTFAIVNSLGAILLLFGIALLYGATGALNLAQLSRTMPAADHHVVLVAFGLICTGFLVKAAALPFHFWLGDAYAVAPTPICIILAGGFSELGLFGLARVTSTAFSDVLDPPALRTLLVIFGVGTALVGAAMCLWQHHLKRQLAFATVAQLGLYLVALGLVDTDALAGLAIWIVGDGLARAALFGSVGVLQHEFGSIREDELHGRGREIWPLGIVVVVCILALASLPPFGPFLGKSAVDDAALRLNWSWIPAMIALVTALTAGTLLRSAARVFAGIGTVASVIEGSAAAYEAADAEEDTEREAGGRRVAHSPMLWIPILALAGGAVAWGLVPGLEEHAGQAAAAFRDAPGFGAIVLDRAGLPLPPPPPTLKPPGTTAYLYAAATVTGSFVVAAIGLARMGRSEPGPLAALRRLHSGRSGDYAAWLAAGAAVLVAASARWL